MVDPGGNWIRVVRGGSAEEPAGTSSRPARSLADAVVAADSREEVDQAARLLDGALRRTVDADPVERVEALAYRAELAVRREDPAALRAALRDMTAVPRSTTPSAAPRARCGSRPASSGVRRPPRSG